MKFSFARGSFDKVPDELKCRTLTDAYAVARNAAKRAVKSKNLVKEAGLGVRVLVGGVGGETKRCHFAALEALSAVADAFEILGMSGGYDSEPFMHGIELFCDVQNEILIEARGMTDSSLSGDEYEFVKVCEQARRAVLAYDELEGLWCGENEPHRS